MEPDGSMRPVDLRRRVERDPDLGSKKVIVTRTPGTCRQQFQSCIAWVGIAIILCGRSWRHEFHIGLVGLDCERLVADWKLRSAGATHAGGCAHDAKSFSWSARDVG